MANVAKNIRYFDANYRRLDNATGAASFEADIDDGKGNVIGRFAGPISAVGTLPTLDGLQRKDRPIVTGSTGANAALQNLLAALASAGVIINQTT